MSFDAEVANFTDKIAAACVIDGVPLPAGLGVQAAMSLDGDKIAGIAVTHPSEGVPPIGTDTLFRIASISKPLTSTAILLLIEQPGLWRTDDKRPMTFDLDTKLYELLYNDKRYKPAKAPSDLHMAAIRSVTVRDLLRHTSGWGSGKKPVDPMLLDWEVKRRCGNEPIPPPVTIPQIIRTSWDLITPGHPYGYANLNYCLLGRIVEEVSGASYDEFVTENILKPLGLQAMKLGRTITQADGEVVYLTPKDQSTAPRSVITGEPDVPVPYGAWNLENMDSHGGWLATADDLVKFTDALFVHKSLFTKPETLKSITDPKNVYEGPDAYGKDISYGLGWCFRFPRGRPNAGEGDGNPWYWHAGGLPGTSTILMSVTTADEQPSRVSWAALTNTRCYKTIDGKRKDVVGAIVEDGMWAAAKVTLPERFES